jgi:hypothetical protein
MSSTSFVLIVWCVDVVVRATGVITLVFFAFQVAELPGEMRYDLFFEFFSDGYGTLRIWSAPVGKRARFNFFCCYC